VTLGLGVFNPFGLGTDWPEDWRGRYVSTKTEIQTFYINPVAAFSMGPVSFAAGMQAVYGTLELNRKVKKAPLGDDVASMHLEGTSDVNYGWNAGIQFRPMQQVVVGPSYRSQVDSKVNGTAAFDSMNAKWTFVKAALPAKADVFTTIPYPAVMAVGVAVTPLSDLTIEANVVQTQWSAFDTLAINFAAPYAALTEKVPELYANARSYRIGAEYRLPDWELALRCGYLYDESPVPAASVSTLLPDGNRDSFQVGVGYAIGNNTTVDLAYMYLKFKDRSTEGVSTAGFNGTYKTSANLFGMTITHRF
jgi:long-chain fatty acid transport protein